MLLRSVGTVLLLVGLATTITSVRNLWTIDQALNDWRNRSTASGPPSQGLRWERFEERMRLAGGVLVIGIGFLLFLRAGRKTVTSEE